MAEKKFNYADGWHPSGPGGKLEYWEKGKKKRAGTEALKLVKNVASEADELIGTPIREIGTDVKNALGDVLKIGQYSGHTENGKQLTVFEARRKGLLPNYNQQGGLMYRLKNLGKDPFTDPTHPDYKDGGKEIGTMVNGKFQTGTGVVTHDAEGRTENVNTGEQEDNTYLPANQSNPNNTGTKDGLKIDPLKEGSAGWRIQQDLIDKGFKQGELDDLRIKHQQWKEQRRKRNKNKNKKKP